MPDIRKAVQQLSRVGVAPSYTGSLSTSDDYLINNDGQTLLHFKKTGAGDCTVTVKTPVTVNGLAVAELTFDVPASSGDVMAGPFPPSVFNVGPDLRFTLSEVTDLSVAAVRI